MGNVNGFSRLVNRFPFEEKGSHQVSKFESAICSWWAGRGSTISHIKPPARAIAAPKKKADLQPYRAAKYGVSDAVRAPPI